MRKAAPLTDLLVARMLAAAGNTLWDLRNKAMLATAYVTMCRRSELVGLLREDLHLEADDFGTVAIRRSKTDQEGAGDVAPITPDAMRHLQAWIEAAGIETGPLFRAVLKGGRVGDALDAGDVARSFKAMGAQAGLSAKEIARISGHSTRVGAAQDAIRYGAELAAVMQAGRWRTPEMVARYTRRLHARRSAAVQIADRRVHSSERTRGGGPQARRRQIQAAGVTTLQGHCRCIERPRHPHRARRRLAQQHRPELVGPGTTTGRASG